MARWLSSEIAGAEKSAGGNFCKNWSSRWLANTWPMGRGCRFGAWIASLLTRGIRLWNRGSLPAAAGGVFHGFWFALPSRLSSRIRNGSQALDCNLRPDPHFLALGMAGGAMVLSCLPTLPEPSLMALGANPLLELAVRLVS